MHCPQPKSSAARLQWLVPFFQCHFPAARTAFRGCPRTLYSHFHWKTGKDLPQPYLEQKTGQAPAPPLLVKALHPPYHQQQVPLVQGEDSVGHITGGCTHPAIKGIIL